jgi:hypothetical protein
VGFVLKQIIKKKKKEKGRKNKYRGLEYGISHSKYHVFIVKWTVWYHAHTVLDIIISSENTFLLFFIIRISQTFTYQSVLYHDKCVL